MLTPASVDVVRDSESVLFVAFCSVRADLLVCDLAQAYGNKLTVYRKGKGY